MDGILQFDPQVFFQEFARWIQCMRLVNFRRPMPEVVTGIH